MMSTRTGVRALVMVTLCYGALEIVGLLLLLLLLLLQISLQFSKWQRISHPIPLTKFFELNTDNRTRGHSLKLVKHRCNCEVRRHFSERVVNRWNIIPTIDNSF